MLGLGIWIVAGIKLWQCQVLLYITSKCSCVSGPKYVIRNIWSAERSVVCSKSTPSKIINWFGLCSMMQWSLVLGQLDQMMLFEDAASIQFPLRKWWVEENLSAVGPWPTSWKVSIKTDIKPWCVFCPRKPHLSVILSECVLPGQVELCFILCNSLLCILRELLKKVVLVHDDGQSSWFDMSRMAGWL